MAEIDGGALSFKSIMDNNQMNAAIDETMRRVQGLSDSTVAGGKKMDTAFNATAEKIRSALGQIGQACETHEQAIAQLEAKYKELGEQASSAFNSGRDKEYAAIKNQQAAIEGEIKTRQQLLQELRDGSNALEEEADKMEANKAKVEENATTHESMRARIRALKEEMMQLADQGIDQNSAAYKALVDELGRLQDIQGDVAAQGRTIANDEQKFAGVISGLSGLAGGFSAVTGAVSLFAGENENLNRIMTKVQSVMAITIGIQQVAETLNKDSAFSLVTLNGLKKWWADVVAKSTVAETAETIATNANTAAQNAQAAATAKNTTTEATNTIATGAQATAATAGTVANIGLAGAFRLVGTAIKSIPVFGWILAGISALIGLYVAFSSKARDAKKAQEEFSKSMIEGCYKPIGTIEELSTKYTALGNNMKAKEKFIQDNKKSFDDLGVSVVGVRDAENLLIANKDRFILAQIAKAKAMVYTQQAADKIKKLMELQAEAEAMPDKKTTYVPTGSGQYGGNTGYYVTGANIEKQNKKKEIADLTKEIKTGYNNAYIEEKNAAYNLKKGGIGAINDYSNGTVGAIEQAISRKQDALKRLKPNSKEWKQTYKDIARMQKQIEAPSTGVTTRNTGGGSTDKDPFLTKLESYKKEYDRFKKWVNSGDSVLTKAAATEFKGLLTQGSSYIDYLKKQRDIILDVDVSKRTKAQNAQLRTLNDQIAEETKKTVLDAFNEELSNSLTNAKTTIEMLNIIAQKRKELANDGTDVDDSKKEALDDAQKNAMEKQKEETDKLLEDYASYLDKKIKLEMQYNNDMTLLEKARTNATTDAERASIQRAIDNRKLKFQSDSKKSGDEDYDAMLETFKSYEQKRQAIIDDYAEKRRIAQAHGDTTLDNQLLKEQSKALLQNSFDELKASPDYIRAFEDLKNVSSETLNALLAKFEEVKEAAAGSLNPEDLREYTDTMTNIVNELNERDPFTAIKNGYKELKAASNELADAQRNLKNIRNDGGSGTDKEKVAIDRVNKAKDNYIKKNNQVRQSEKVATNAVKELCDNLSNVGDAVGGEAGQIISLIGNVGSFTMDAIQGMETASKASSAAMQTVEKASVILTIISTAWQVVNKVAEIFGGDDGEAAYQKAEGVYKAYIEVLNDVIDKQKELVESMSGENATNSYKYALSLINQQVDAARELGRQYLNAGASKGFLGIGSKASHGVSQREGISDEAWSQLAKVASSAGFNYSSVAGGRMTGLFDLSVEQLRQLKENAPIFWAQLHEDTRTYLQAIIDCDDAAGNLKDTLNESITGVTFDSMSDDFLDTLEDMDSDAETFSKNFSEYMRKAMIQNIYKAQFKDQLQKWYQMWSDAMNADGEGGTTITANEQEALDTLKNSIISGATSAADKINKQFNTDTGDDDSSLTGAVKGVSEETASMVGGQMNAMRINQIEATNLLRQQLGYLSTIAQNTSYNKNLVDIRNDIRDMKNAQTGTSLRSQGLS